MKKPQLYALWTLGALVALLGLAALLWQPLLGQALGERLFARGVASAMASDISDGRPAGMIVGICGAGGPLAAPERSGPCALVKVDERVFVVDVGNGASREMRALQVDLAQLQAVLLTHFHSDHIDGLGELLLQAWISGSRKEPMPVYGPEGVEQVVAGFNQAYRLDSGYRTEHHGAAIADPAGYGGAARSIRTLRGGDSAVVYDVDGLSVTVFAVDHDPAHPAVGYRFDYRGRSVVISGDTAAVESVQLHSVGADLLVHEALQPRLAAMMGEQGAVAGNSVLAKIAADIPDYHTSPEEAAALAQSAGVRHLLLTHIVPPLPSRLLERAFLGDAASMYDGPITIARNGTVVTLPENSDDVLVEP